VPGRETEDEEMPESRSEAVVPILPLGERFGAAHTAAILRSEQLEIVRLVLHAGKILREHRAPGEISLQCIEGKVELSVPSGTHELGPGDLIHLRSQVPHSLRALLDSSLLLTLCIVRSPTQPAQA
jgi:quercetin dioxygenase-like cupin family protein